MDSKATIFLLPFLLVVHLQLNGVHVLESTPSMVLPGCREKCGDIAIPYPFGTVDGCSRDRGLLLSCNRSTPKTPRLFLELPGDTQMQVTNLTFDSLTIAYTRLVRECASTSLELKKVIFDLGVLPYTLSASLNKFTVIGCDSMGLFSANQGANTGCISSCSSNFSIPDGACTGEGCCQSSLRTGVKNLVIGLGSPYGHNFTRSMSNCSVAFPVQQDWYRFRFQDVRSFPRTDVPVVLEWAIGTLTCKDARRAEGFACVADNTTCVDSESGEGYRCHCKDGYQGNPYLAGGCQDIDECQDSSRNQCSNICTNTPGSYTCSCPKGYNGDGRTDGKGCNKNNSNFPLSAQITLGVGLSIMAILATISFMYYMMRKRQYILVRQEYFEKNGGVLLKQQMSGSETARIFTEEEFKKATDGFSESRVLGKGGNGTVYKGFLPDNRVVAIKKSKAVDQTQMDQFINEILILTKVIHRNVVRILGCCLETEVPLLAYEYIPNGTLHDHLHSTESSLLSWEKRLRIAAETAGAIAYLHTDLSRPIIHRDIKSANILLDNSFTAKVADFGASRLAPLDEEEMATMVQGTLGYLDPEYLRTGYLTDRSDVYSFGVVLAELLTGQKSISFFRTHEHRTLATYFLLTIKDDGLHQILDPNIVGELRDFAQVTAVSQITVRCLAMKAEDRPSMKEVAAELDRLRGYGAPPSMPPLDPDDRAAGMEEAYDSYMVTPRSYYGSLNDAPESWMLDLER